MVQVAILGTNGSHSGSYVGSVTGATSVITSANGQVAQLGDAYNCPEHGAQTLSSGGSTILSDKGNPIAISGTVVSCGAVLDSGFAEYLSTNS